ncbi:MAG: PP2C family protein-serine/threonine phosphatase [Solirubrobacteraceae bacterium]
MGKAAGVGKGDEGGGRGDAVRKGNGIGKASAATLTTPKVETSSLPHVSLPNLPVSTPESSPAAPPAPPAPASTPSSEATPDATSTHPAESAPAPATPIAPANSPAPRHHAGGSARHATLRGAHTSHRHARQPGAPTARSAANARFDSPVAAGGRSGRHARNARPARRPQPASQLEPIVKTITKIVGVVPLVVRVLIGALLALALALGVRSRLAALRSRRLERQRAQLLQDVGLLQAALLPVSPARIGPVETSVAYTPADGPAAGGDFYDVFALDDGTLGVIVGDVSGHGRQALPHTALLRFTLRAYLEAGLSPREVLRTAGTVLERQLGASFATVVAATYHPRERTLAYASAGHPPPVVAGGGVALVPVTVSASPPIGTGMRTGARQTVVSVPGAARVCFHTDGLTEARVGSELFGTERLTRAVQELDPGSGASTLLERVVEQTDARPDDMAACLLAIDGAHQSPHVLVEQLQLGPEDADGRRLRRFLAACGVDAAQVAKLTSEARACMEHADAVLLEVRFAGGSPHAALAPDNVASLRASHPAQPAVLGAVR